MGKEILRGFVLWGRCLIWAIVLASPFVWIWQAHPGPGQELSPLWEWLEADSSVQGYAKIIVVVIGLVWFVSGVVFKGYDRFKSGYCRRIIVGGKRPRGACA